MTFSPDPRVDLARLVPMSEAVHRLGLADMRRDGRELVGPCPVCGGKDRFQVNVTSGVFFCRQCPDARGDALALVAHVMGCDFLGAVSYLVGERAVEVTPAEIERRRRLADVARKKAEGIADDFRARAIKDAVQIWTSATPALASLVEEYLARRGIPRAVIARGLPSSLRFKADHPYVRRIGGDLVTLHRGPCMVAAIQGRDGRLSAVHQTWLDLSAEKGRATIKHGAVDFPSKLMRGSKKGGAIRLSRSAKNGHCAPRALVMGEGIETTFSALACDVIPGAAYWAGADLGNMSGVMEKGARGVPDLSDLAAFVPPPWVSRLVFIQDGDSAPAPTRARLEAGLRRARHFLPDLITQIVHPGAGVDLNDVLRGG
jgi:hypothetical protein